MTDLKILNACIPDYDNDNFVMGDILINDGKIVKISACGEIEEETEVAKWKCTTTRIELGNIDKNETDVYTSTSNLILFHNLHKSFHHYLKFRNLYNI